MNRIPADKQYTDTHLWFAATGEDEGLLGLTDYAQRRLGDLISAELPRSSVTLALGDTLFSLEGILGALEVEAPAQLEVLEINPRLEIHADAINRAPYTDGWVLKVRLRGLVRWMDAPTYAEFLRTGVLPEGA